MKTRERERLLAHALAAADGPHLAKWLVGNGIRLGCDLVAGGIGKAQVAVDGSGFEFNGAGQWMMIMGVYVSPWPWPTLAADFAVLDKPVPIDVLAFRPGEPGRWWLMEGLGEWLGEWCIGNRPFGAWDGPLRLFSTPLAWLRGGCAGAVLLRPCAGLPVGGWKVGRDGPYLRDLLHGCPGVICDDDDHAAVIDAALRKRPPVAKRPQVFVVAGAREKAA